MTIKHWENIEGRGVNTQSLTITVNIAIYFCQSFLYYNLFSFVFAEL